MESFYLIAWKQFENRKIINKQQLVKTEHAEKAITNIKKLNAERRLTTTEYRAFNLEKILNRNKLKIIPA